MIDQVVLIATLQTLREYGVHSFKHDGLEIILNEHAPSKDVPVDPAKIEQFKEVASLLKLDDQGLVDQLFPNHIEESAVE
jgi:hypothetical protein